LAFIIRIYHDARSSECQKLPDFLIYTVEVTLLWHGHLEEECDMLGHMSPIERFSDLIYFLKQETGSLIILS